MACKTYSIDQGITHWGWNSRAVLCRTDWPDDTKVTVSMCLLSTGAWVDCDVLTLGEIRNQAGIHPRQYASRQRVMLNNRWTYEWAGDSDLQIGDQVLVPASEYYPQKAMTVTALTSDYDGHLVRIIGRAAGAV